MSCTDISKNDDVVIDINSLEECPMCYHILTDEDSSTCPQNIANHRICNICNLKLKKDYFQNEEQNCIYCEDRAEKPQKNTVVIPIQIQEVSSMNHITIRQSDHFIKFNWITFCFVIIGSVCLIMAYYMLNACYAIGTSVYHSLFENHNHHSHDISLKHAFYGLLIWICFATFCTIFFSSPFYIYEKMKVCKNR